LNGVVNRYAEVLVGGQLQQAGILAADSIAYVQHDLAKQGYTGLFLAYKLVLLEMWYQKIVVQ